MPFKEADATKARMRFVTLSDEGLFSHTELCKRFGVSRQAGYDVIERFQAEGVDGLKDHSHAPKQVPHRISDEIAALLVKTREAHDDWGPRKILAYLAGQHPELKLPAASTVGDLLKRRGMVQARPPRRVWRHPGRSTITALAPNDMWSVDFKGQFRTRDGQTCYPLTVADTLTRFLLGCDGLGSTGYQGARAVFERLFREYGMPAAIRSDNGAPFSSRAIAGISRLSVWWTQLGIHHDRTEPGHPEQNGSHERMHRTLKRATVYPPAADAAEQQERFHAFRAEYNHVRPHEALEMKTPGSRYQPSARTMPERLARPEYPGHCIVRQVRANGIVHFRDRDLFLSEVLIGHEVAFEEIDDRVWSVYFYDLLLARLDERSFTFSG
jgi:transposase InsO family protein